MIAKPFQCFSIPTDKMNCDLVPARYLPFSVNVLKLLQFLFLFINISIDYENN